MLATALPQSKTQIAGCAHDLISAVAARQPNHVALIQGSRRWSYRELEEHSNNAAATLLGLGIPAGSLVGIHADSAMETIAALLGVLKAGCGFVPLDPSWPRDRVITLIEDSNVAIVAATERLRERLSTDTPSLSIEDLTGDGARQATPNHPVTAQDDVSCVLYTSGSSGQPKGVAREHRNIVSRLAWSDLEPNDVGCHNMSLSYGFSQERLMVPLMKGLPLVVLPDRAHKDAGLFAKSVGEFGITTVTVVPAFLEQLVSLDARQLQQLKSLRKVAVGSAPLSASLVRRVREVLPEVTLINAYGGTEAGSAARGVITNAELGVTIGRPVGNAEIYIVDECLSQVPDGAIGELCVGGPGIAREYWRQPKLTAERFVPNPFHTSGVDRLYRTGDFGRYLPDGRIELTGRADRQVKIRGYRVEFGEVESALARHSDIQEVVVVGQPVGSDNRLLAYVSLREGCPKNVTSLREHLREGVPDHMLPSAYVFVAALPRTAIGKVDINALPAPGVGRPELTNSYVAPRNRLEDEVATIWAEILEVDLVGVEDHFLDLGGDSLLAVRIVAAMETQLGWNLSAESLFDYPTVSQFAAFGASEGNHARL